LFIIKPNRFRHISDISRYARWRN